jgi:hypothetical protein
MKKPINPLVLLTLILMAATACASKIEPTPEKTSDSPPLPETIEAAPPIDVCEPLDVPGVAFPRQEYVAGPREMGAAELIGKLELVDGYLQVDSYGDGWIIPVWPAEYTLAYKDSVLTIFDGDGNPLIREGEEVYMGGGEGYDGGLLNCVRQQLPDTFNRKFWYVGDGVRPNLRFDSDLFHLSVITSTERMAILLEKRPILDEWIESPSTISGKFVLYTPSRCPRLFYESGMTRIDYLPIWPSGYNMEFKDNKLIIKDETGNIIASEGDELTLSGGGIPHSWESGEYRHLNNNIPGDCYPPYWIVGE